MAGSLGTQGGIFTQGVVPSSFGLRVAQMAGLPQSVLDCARLKAADFADVTSSRMFEDVASCICRASTNMDVTELKRIHQHL